MTPGAPPQAVRDSPPGFYLAGMLSMAFSLILGCIVIDDLLMGGGPVGEDFVTRGALVLLTCLGTVVTEALWFMRPFVFRASVAMAATWAVFLLSLREPLVARGVMILLSALLLVPILLHIRNQSRRIWPAAPPVPAPVVVPGARP